MKREGCWVTAWAERLALLIAWLSVPWRSIPTHLMSVSVEREITLLSSLSPSPSLPSVPSAQPIFLVPILQLTHSVNTLPCTFAPPSVPNHHSACNFAYILAILS